MLSLNIKDFAGTTLLDPRDILAVFYANWCPFCRSFLKVFETSMKERTHPLGALVDISDYDTPLWETFAVEIVPTVIGFYRGEVVARKDGVSGAGLDALELEDALRQMKRTASN